MYVICFLFMPDISVVCSQGTLNTWNILCYILRVLAVKRVLLSYVTRITLVYARHPTSLTLFYFYFLQFLQGGSSLKQYNRNNRQQ